MSYVIIDLDGASRGRFASRTEVVAALDEVRREEADLLEELSVVEYDGEGKRVGGVILATNLMPQPMSSAPMVVGLHVTSSTFERQRPVVAALRGAAEPHALSSSGR